MAVSYETVLVLSVKESDETVKANVEKFTELIAKGGSVDKVDEWGKRRLAYPINYETEGYYVVYEHTAQPEYIAELSRVFNISDILLRYLTVRKDEE